MLSPQASIPLSFISTGASDWQKLESCVATRDKPVWEVYSKMMTTTNFNKSSADHAFPARLPNEATGKSPSATNVLSFLVVSTEVGKVARGTSY